MKHIGILGGGQLGAFLAESLFHLGAAVHVFDPNTHAPGAMRTPLRTHASWDEIAFLRRFAQNVDTITFETEKMGTAALDNLDFALLEKMMPSLDILKISQNRLKEKHFFQELGVATLQAQVARSQNELEVICEGAPGGLVVKAVDGDWGGVQQWRTTPPGPGGVGTNTPRPPSFPVLVEPLHPVDHEFVVLVARGPLGRCQVFPPIGTFYKGLALDVSILPAPIPEAVVAEAQAIALNLAHRLQMVGLLSVEFFYSKGPQGTGQLLVNELAPRPHSCGHITRKSCNLSQFDALAWVLMGHEVPPIQVVAPGAFCMATLWGNLWPEQLGEDVSPQLSRLGDHPSVVEVSFYGKRPHRSHRKMGHLVVRDPGGDPQRAIELANRARDALAEKT